MKPGDLQEQGPRLRRSEIARFEREIGFDLPMDYRNFLQQTNGGVVPELHGYFYLEAGDWWNHIDVFYGLYLPETPSIELMRALRRLLEQYPEVFDLSLGKLNRV